jgi:iron-sulfur cluster assembly protein
MSIEVTERAANHIQSALRRHAESVGLRLGVKTTGCSGFSYTVDYAERIGEGDQVFEQHGVRVVVDRKSLPFLEGVRVDFVRDGLNEHFTFSNPNVKDTCGCGESFSV